MRFRVKDYCRIILYLPSEDKQLKASFRPQKPKRIEDDVDMRLSEDETPVEPEDATTPNALHRPPSYNPEDYAHAIAKYSRSPNLYAHDHKDKKSRGKDREKHNSKDVSPEMSLKQFASLPELLRRLREDLRTAFISFVKELVRDPHDGVTLLLDLLKMIQLAQTNLSGNATNREQQIALRRALIDEFECLSCLRCCLRCSDAAPRLANYRNGLYVLAAATMSSLTRSRTLALQLLTKSCEYSSCGHRQVVEAFSTLRLRFAEPVRCKFLVSMMLSYPHPSFQVWGLKFINTLLSSSISLRERIYLQEEIGEAGFDVASIRKALEHRGAATQQQADMVRAELDKWSEGYIDLTALEQQLSSLKSSNTSLKQELQHLRQANMKLLEENVLFKAVGGEVEERCIALKRRLEKHGIPSAPSPTPSVTDSEVSSFVTTGRSTVRRNNLDSPNRTMERVGSNEGTLEGTCGAEGERSMSLEWKMIRPSPEGRGPSRQGSSSESGSMVPPIPLKRHLLQTALEQLPSLINNEVPKRSVYVNDICLDGFPEMANKYRRNENDLRSKEKMTNKTTKNQEDQNSNLKTEDMRELRKNGDTPEENQSRVNSSVKEEEHVYQCPVKQTRPKGQGRTKNSSSSSKSSNNSVEKENNSSTNKSLSSSTSSLSITSSTASLDEAERKEHEYENIPKKEAERAKSQVGSDEGDIEYERDVVVYEAITVGNDTIVLDKSSTHGSKGSNKSRESSSSSDKSYNEFVDNSCVQLPPRYYENVTNKNNKREDKDDKSESSRNIINGIINGFINNKKKDSKSAKEKLPKKESKKDKRKNELRGGAKKSDDVSEREVEDVMNGLENILRSAESSISFGSLGTVKENPLLKENFEDRASPDQPTDELEIVPTRAPPLPPRSRSQNSRNHTPDPVVYLESPSETSDTDTFNGPNKGLVSPVTMDTASTKSFGWVRSEQPGLRRRDTFVGRTQDKHSNNIQPRLRRSESVHANNIMEYNSHRSFSPRRRGSTELLVPLEEIEVQISGRRYTRYTASDIEQKNRFNNLVSSEAKRSNRSVDSRLDQWLDQDCLRRSQFDNEQNDGIRHSRGQYRSNEEEGKNSRNNSNESRNLPPKPSRGSKSRFSSSELTAFGGFKNPTAGMRESDYGPNFMLNSPSHHRLEEVLSDLADFGSPNHGRSRNGRGNRKIMMEDPAIPTPDYSATPAGTLTNDVSVGKHILEMASGLY